MRKATTTEAEVVRFRQDIQVKLRARVQAAIDVVLEEELEAAGCVPGVFLYFTVPLGWT